VALPWFDTAYVAKILYFNPACIVTSKWWLEGKKGKTLVCVFTFFASSRLPPPTHSLCVLSSPSCRLSPLAAISRCLPPSVLGIVVAVQCCCYCEGVVDLGPRLIFYCWFLQFCCWLLMEKEKVHFVFGLSSILGFGVCSGWVKVCLLCNFWWKMKFLLVALQFYSWLLMEK